MYNMWVEYPSISGTPMGEVRNEIYNRYGITAVENTRYGYHHEMLDSLTIKEYHLVPTEPAQYLIAIINYHPRVFPKHQEEIYKNLLVPNIRDPNTLHLEWIPVSACSIPYTL